MLANHSSTAEFEGGVGPEPAMLALLDDSEAPIAACQLLGNSGRIVEIAVARDVTGTLLDYLYCKGGRAVALERDGVRLRGRLSTRWDSHRRWFVELR